MNKKIKKITLIVIAIILLGSLLYFISLTKKSDNLKLNNLSDIENISGDIVESDYGFSFKLPKGWHIWEGVSSANEIASTTDFIEVLERYVEAEEKNISLEDSKKISEYQKIANDWRVNKSKNITLTKNKVDYSERDLAESGKYLSVEIGDELNLNSLGLIIGGSTIDFSKEIDKNTDDIESGSINIKGIKSRYSIGKKHPTTNTIIIRMPISLRLGVDGKNEGSIGFLKYVDKSNNNGFRELVSFIESLDIKNIL